MPEPSSLQLAATFLFGVAGGFLAAFFAIKGVCNRVISTVADERQERVDVLEAKLDAAKLNEAGGQDA